MLTQQTSKKPPSRPTVHCAATVHSAQKLKYIHLVDIVLFVNYSKIFSTARVACKLTERVLQIGCSHHQSSIMKLDFVMDFNMVTPHSVPPLTCCHPPHICYRARLTSALEWSWFALLFKILLKLNTKKWTFRHLGTLGTFNFYT